MTPGNVTFWQLISNRGSHKKKKRRDFMRESLWEKTKDKKELRAGGILRKALGRHRSDLLCANLFSSPWISPWKPSLILQLRPWTNYGHGTFTKVQTIKAKAALSRLHRAVCTLYFIFNLTGEIDFMMAESATWRSNNLGCLAITCPCKYASPVRIEQKISRLDKII